MCTSLTGLTISTHVREPLRVHKEKHIVSQSRTLLNEIDDGAAAEKAGKGDSDVRVEGGKQLDFVSGSTDCLQATCPSSLPTFHF